MDGMLGKIARILRLLGYDVVYPGGVSDKTLLSLAKETGCLLVTKDKGLYRQVIAAGFEALLLTDDGLENMLAGVLKKLGVTRIAIDPRRARCPYCNTPVTVFNSPEAVADDVPSSVANRQQEFYRCMVCGRTYWVGKHWRNIKNLEARVNAILAR